MSHLDTPPFDATATGPQKTSGLAIASLVCSLICCIPVTTILAILLGAGALISIGGDPAKKGKGMAITGIVLGIIFTVAQAIIGPWLYGVGKEYYAFVASGPQDALVAGFAGDTAGFKGQFHGAGAAASDAEAQAFISALRSRYGEFVACSMDEQAPRSQGTFGQPIVPFPYVFEFENATVNGQAEIAFSDPNRGGFMKKIVSITIYDDDLVNLTYPAPIDEVIEEAGEALEEALDEAIEVPTGGDGG